MKELHIGRQVLSSHQRFDIVGPCAAQSLDQVQECAAAVREVGIGAFRACVFKPRTAPSPFEGVGAEGYSWLAQVSSDYGVTIATELRHGDQVEEMAEVVFRYNPDANIVVWVGSRNTDHINVRSIGRAASQDSRISVGHKNPMHYMDHHSDWIGLVEHLRSGGMPDERVFLVHRGFKSNKFMPNPLGLKNIPDHDVAMHVSEEMRLPIIMDVSHPAGTASLVEVVAEGARAFAYRGLMIEAATPRRIPEAITDKAQHVTIEEAAAIINRDIYARKNSIVRKLAA